MFDEEREEERIAALPPTLRAQWQPDDGLSTPGKEIKGFTYNGQSVPVEIMRSLIRYLVSGIRPGSFLCDVLENDLMGAVLRADDENAKALPGMGSLSRVLSLPGRRVTP